ncbi:MAG: CoA-binding protein, partial [Chloroflexi bacterium]|nr:CoA-binding protein [Chloroflexota bacterium]
VPGPVDLVIVCAPRTTAIGILDDCAAKAIKAVYFYAAGFSETGEPEWAEVEKDMVASARRGGFRIIGPNCFGVYSPECGIPYGPFNLMVPTGSVGFISQSSGHMGKILEFGLTHGMGFSKGMSLGNAADLGSAEVLEYMALDPSTSTVGLYLEGPRDAARLFEVMRIASELKPIVVLKGGRSAAGARATASHTGALAASAAVWSAALRQVGAVEAHSLEELMDTLLLFDKVGQLPMTGLGVICGISDGGGGEAVHVSDVCAAFGIDVPPLTAQTGQEMERLLSKVGSVLCNPVDMSQRQQDPEALRHALELTAAQPGVGAILVYVTAGLILASFLEEVVQAIGDTIVKFKDAQSKPVLVVLPSGPAEVRRLAMEQRLSRPGIPVFPDIERAAKAVSNVHRYSRLHHRTTPR